MKTSAIIEFKDTYASMECHELGYQTKETALAIISPTGHILSSTPLFRKVYGSNTAHIDQLPFNIDNLSITARGLSKKANLLVVCHCYRKSDTIIRIISARKATVRETISYNKNLF